MENSKVNSQDLVAGAVGRNEDVFNAINYPDSHIFSLQRFADGDNKAIILRQEGGSATTLLSPDSLTGVLSAYTLGRSASETQIAGTVLAEAGSEITVGGTHFYIAPLFDGTNTYKDPSYKLTAYNLGVNGNASDVRIAIAYNDLPAHSTTGTSPTYNYMVGILTSDTNVLINPDNPSFNYPTQAPWSGTYKLDAGQYESLYKMMLYKKEMRFGSSTGVVASSSGKFNVTLDFYDVKLGSHTATAALNALETGTYVYRDTSGRAIDFKAQKTLTFDGIEADESETYKINGVNVLLQGGSNAATATFTADSYSTSDPQSFNDISINSNVSIAFTLDGLGSGTGVSLDGVTYKSNNDSGTVTFSMSGTSNFITLGNGDFVLGSVASDGTIYNLDSKTTGTFTVGTNGAFILDVDGSATGFAPVTFSSTSGGTIIAHYGDSNITLSGSFAISGADSATQLGFTLSDGSVATINGLTFTDAEGDGSSTFVYFSSISDITIGGAFDSINSGTDKVLTNLAFTLNDSTTAALGTFSASDTADGDASKVIFDADSNTFTLAGDMSVSGTFANATFTLSDVAVYNINGTDYEVKTNKAGTGDDNKLTFISDTVKADAFAHLDTSSLVANVTGFSAGDNISVASDTTYTIEGGKAQLLEGYYFSTQGENGASGTVQFSNTGIVLTGNLIASTASGTQLIGLNGESFTATAGSFFVQDTGTVKINSLVFTDVSDSYVSELVYSAKDSSMGVYGAFTLSGSDTDLTYTLNGFNGSNSSIVMSGIKFEGTGTSVQNTEANQYSLGASNSAVFNITSEKAITASSFTLLANADGVFNFGGLGIDATGSALTTSAVEVGIGGVTLSADSSVATVMIAGSEVAINDAGKLDPYRITLNEGKVDTIYNIDGGASITALADANTMITSSSGTFLFNNSSTLGTGTQIFKINGDNEVTFTISSGTVVAIAGIDENTQIDFTDTVKGTSGTKSANWNKTYKLSDVITRNANGTWGLDKYIAYIANYSDTSFTFTGIDENGVHYSEITSNYFGKTGTTLSVLESVFDSATQVVFQNTSENAYSAQFSGTTGTPTTIFSDLSTTGAGFGVLFESGETMALSFASVPGEGTATALTSLANISDTTFSLKLSDYALNVYSDYNVSGTGVSVTADSTTVVGVSANGKTAVVNMPGESYIKFGASSGTYVINGLTTQTLTVDASTANSTAVGTNTDVFTLALAGGAVLSDTFKTNAASSLKVNNIVYSLATGDSATFVYTSSGSGSASDTLAVTAGFLTQGNGIDGATGTSYVFDNGAGMLFDNYSFTGKVDATAFTLAAQSESYLATVTSGTLLENVAANSKFIYKYSDTNNVYTAREGGVSFNIGASTNTFVSGSGTRILDADSTFTMAGGANGELSDTYTFNSGTVLLTVGTTSNGATESITNGTGTYTGATFHISDFYLNDGKGDDRNGTTTYLYTVTTGDSATLTWTINATNGIGASNTMTLSTGFGATRSSTSAADATFVFGKGDDSILYNTSSDELSFYLSKESGESIGAAGVIWEGSGTRTYKNGDIPAGSLTTETWLKEFNYDMYSPSDGATLQLTVIDGAAVSETFLNGSGTYTAKAGEGVFHFGNNAYTATSAVELGAYFTSNTAVKGTLFSASGAGNREGSGTYIIAALNDVSFTMNDSSTWTIDFANYATDKVATETVTAGSGIVASATSFTLSEYWMNDGVGSTDTYTFKQFGNTEIALSLTLVGKDSGTIKVTSGLGVRTDTFTLGETFTYAGQGYTAMTNTSFANNTFTFAIGGSGTTAYAAYVDASATGMVFSGAGYRNFNKSADSEHKLAELTYNEDTYSFESGTLNMTLTEGVPSYAAGAGSATYVADMTTNTTFHFNLSGATPATEYKVLSETTLYGVVGENGSITSLYQASGAGYRENGSGTFVATALNSDTYTFDKATMLLDFGTMTEGKDNLDALKESVYSGENGIRSGTGTGFSFTLNDAWLADGDSTTTTNYTYHALDGSSVKLSMTLESGTGTISITNGIGVRETNTLKDNSFTYKGADYTASGTSFTFAIGAIDGYNVESAEGVLYSGAGYRDFNASDTDQPFANVGVYNSDTYTMFAGTVNLALNAGSETFSAGAGSATYTTTSGQFHFGVGGGTDNVHEYTATTKTVLYGIVGENGSVTSLYNATGAGERTGVTCTYTIATLSDTFNMDATSVLTIDFSQGGINASETYTSGSGSNTFTTFAINDDWLTGEATGTTVYTYTAISGSEVTLGLTLSGETGTITINAGFATRTDTLAGGTFTYDGNTYTETTSGASFTYSIGENAEVASGELYAGVGYRDFTIASDTFEIKHLSDTYTAENGRLQLTLDAGTASTALTMATATYTANVSVENTDFHFSSTYGTFAYTALTETNLSVVYNRADDGTTSTSLISASGAGTRPIETATSFALSALNNDSYTFAAGATALLSISDVSTYNETAYTGTGSGTFENTTFYAAFDADGVYSSTNPAFTYKASGTAVLTATLAYGSTTGQAIISGVGYRTGATDTTFVYGGETYSSTATAGTSDAANLTFKLDSTTTLGAVGDFVSGFGYKSAASKTYTPDGSERYTLDGAAEWQLMVGEGFSTLDGGASELRLFTANTTNDFASGTTFAFKGTTYTVDTTTAILTLTATKGDVTEMFTSGSAVFNGTSSDTTFTYDTNEYTVVGSATLRLTAGQTEPTFVKGNGQKEMSSTGTGQALTFKYTDGNTYTVTSTYALLTAEGNDSIATVNFASGTAVDELAEGATFYFDSPLDGVGTQTYTANSGGATLGITGTTEATAYAEFIGGSGDRTQNSATGLQFVFDNNTYTSTADTFTWTLSYDEDTKTADEKVSGAEGSRTVLGGTTFTYISPLDNTTHTYKVQTGSDVSLAISMVGGNGTETMTAGAATRDLASGKTFEFAPDALFGQSATFTATASGTYILTANTATEGMETLDQTDYDGSSVNEEILGVTATGTKVGEFNYLSIVTAQTETYNSAAGVTFELEVTDIETNTLTWQSGSATMKLAADRTFGYMADNATSSHTYTVDTEGATFTRTSQTEEYLSDGIGYRALESGSDIFNVTYLSDTYTADSGRINLNASGTSALESFNSGTATFALTVGGDNFHFTFDGKTNEYTVTESGTLQVNVADGSATKLFAASGAGTRAQNASDTAQVYILDDIYNVSSGTYKLSLGTAAVGDESETLIGGAGVFTTTSQFHVSDFYLNGGADTTTYTYDALGGSEVQLALTINGADSQTIQLTSGIGTRDYNSETFTFNVGGTDYNYTASGTIVNAISADSQTSAAGYIYKAVGTREGADTNTTFYFREDLYTAQSGTMQLTVNEGVGTEDMISGTATYVANSGDAFHYDLSNTGVVRAYTALSETTLTTTFSNGTGTAVFAAISGAGTRDATASDTSFTYTYEEDVYNAVAGSSTILLDATTDDVFETLYGGLVVDEVAANANFHYNVDGTLYAYKAQSETTIEYTIGADSGTKSFTANPYGTRTATDTTFNINSHDYTLNSGENETFLLSGTGTNLVDSLYTANGYRTDVQNETYTSLWNNTYNLSSGTYTIAVTGGVGTETLTTAAAELAVTAGGSVYYGDSSTAYTANIDGATLNFTVTNSVESEALTAGAIYNASGTYLVASGNFTVGTAGNATLTAPTADSSTLVTVTAGDAITAASASLVGAFASGNTLNVNDKVIAADSAATLNIYDVSNVAAASGSFAAQGDFTGGDFVIDSGTVQIEADTDITVAFDTSAITAINNLTDGVTVKDAAGATKAYTDSTGTFKFENTVTAGQSFNISTDNEVTFQIDSDGIVTNIAGLNYDGTDIVVKITDGNWTDELTVTDTGKVLTRNSDGTWSADDVDAVAYIVEVASDSSVLVSAIDANSNTTQIQPSLLGSYSTANGAIAFAINSGVDVAAKPVYVQNNATDTVINVTGYVTGIGNTAEDMAVRIDSTDSGVVNIYKASATTFDSVTGYTISNGTFSVGSAGEVTLATAGSATASVITNNDSAVVGLKDDGAFAVNEGPAVTLATGADDDSTTANVYTTQLNGTALAGLTPSGVETGTVKLDSTTETVTFKINDASVSVTNDNDSDGITLEIQDNALVGVNNVSTDATINASGADKLAINGDTDNVLTDTSLPVKYNTTDSKWISGDAPAKEANGYLVTVDSAGTVHLAYTTSTQTDTKVTTNKNDYAAAFSGNLTLEADGGTLPNYSGAIGINDTLGSNVGVSVVTAYGEGVNITDESEKALTLVTANGNFSVNGQEIIPSAAANVTAISGGAQVALNSDVTITHSSMGFTATSDTSAIFASNAITLSDTAKVSATSSDQNFVVYGTVSFDGIAVKGSNATVNGVTSTAAPSGLTVNEKDLIVTGGDLNYTVDVSTDTAVISGITSAATVDGALVAGAIVQTDATGTYKIGASNDFTITGDSAVDFAVASGTESVVTAISGVGSDTVTGSVIGDFTNAVAVNGKTVLVRGDELVSVSANGSQVTQIDGVGGGETVSVANAGGATLVNTDATGNFYFGDGSTNSQLFIVGDDAQVGFLTSSLSGDVPSVVGVTNFDEGTLEIAQSATAFTINNENAINIANDSSDTHVTLDVGSSVITAVHGLTGEVSGLSTGVAVEVIDSNVTINSAQLSVNEVDSLNVVASAVSGAGYDVVTGLNTNATVNVAANVSVKTEGAGVFTFVDDIFTITGDPSVTFVTDGNSRVKNVADFAGTLTSTESDVTVNGAAISMTNTDASITAAAGNVTVSGLADGDAVTVPTGAVVEMPGTTDDNTDTSITINDKPYTLEGDGDGVAIRVGSPNDSIAGLDAGARLTVGAAGTYTVNGSAVSASIGAVIVGDAEGAAHVASAEDITFDSDTSTDEVVNKILNGDVDAESTDKYVDHVTDTSRAAALIAEGGSALDGNLDMVIGDSDTSESQTADFSSNKGIKKVTMGGNNDQNIKFNDEGGNVAIIGAGVEGEKNVSLGAGGDLAVVEKTDTPVNITAGKGRDTIVSQGRNISVNISAGGPTRLMATAGTLNVTGYDHTTGAGVQLTNSDVARAVQRNAIQLANGSVGVNGATVNLNTSSDAVGSSIVNFYNLKGKMTKVGFTHSSGGTVNLAEEKTDVVMKGNYSGADDQDDSARAGKKDGGSTLIGGAGNDSAFGGAGDRINLGSGDNYVAIDNKRTNSDSGATIEQTSTSGRTVIDGFNNNDFSDMGDRVRISTSAKVKFVNGVLTFAIGAAQLILNGVTSAIANARSSDLAESADIVNSDYSFARTMIEDEQGNLIRAAIAEEGKWIQVTSANAEDYMATAYLGENSGIDFASYDGTVNLTLADGDSVGTGTIGGTSVNVRGITKIQLGLNNSTVIGAANTNNTIAAGEGNASMWGGGASNDTLIGNTLHSASNDFFYFDGNGRDYIQDFEFITADNHSTADRLNILNSGLSNALASGTDLVVEFGNVEDRLTIKDGLGKDIVVERGAFGGSYDTLVAQVNTDNLNYDGQANYFYAIGKNATVSVSSELYNAEINIGDRGAFDGDIKVINASAVQGTTTLMGNNNDNSILGSSENSSMWGGAIGNDTLVGGAGVNTFFYGKNNGNDVATNVDDNDIVNLYDVELDDIVVTSETGGEMISSNAVTIALKDSAGGGTLTVQTSANGTGFRMANGQTYIADHQSRTWSVK